MAGASKLIQSIGSLGEGTLASKLGAALGEKAITESISAEEKAVAALTKLKEQGVPLYKADIESLKKTASENPTLEIDDLVSKFTSETAPVPTVTSLPGEPYKGIATPPPVTLGGKEYPSTFEMEPAARTPGTTSLPKEYLTPESTPQVGGKWKTAAGIGTIVGLGAGGTALVRDAVTGKVETVKIPEKEKQTGVQPVPPSGGVSPTEPPAQVKPTPPADKEQAKKADTIENSLDEIGKIQAAFGANKTPDRTELNRLLDSLEKVKPDTTNLKDPVTRNFLQDKAEAFRAYREKADRNDWLEIAQNLVNSLTQFASTQAAQGTRFVGGGLPLPTTDYGAKTGRALQEYKLQAEDISGEQKAAESAQERVDRLRKEEMAGRRAGLGERIAAERERIRQEESDAKQAGRDAISLYGTLQSNKRAMEQNETAIQKAILQHEQRKDQASEKLVDNQIGYLASQETQLKKQLDAANELMGSDKKNYEKKLADWAASAGQNAAGVVDKAQKESGFFTSNKDYVQETLAPQHAQMVQEQLATIGKQLGELRAAKYSGQQTTQAATPPAVAPSTKWNAGDIVMQGNKKYRFKGGDTNNPANYEEVK